MKKYIYYFLMCALTLIPLRFAVEYYWGDLDSQSVMWGIIFMMIVNMIHNLCFKEKKEELLNGSEEYSKLIQKAIEANEELKDRLNRLNKQTPVRKYNCLSGNYPSPVFCSKQLIDSYNKAMEIDNLKTKLASVSSLEIAETLTKAFYNKAICGTENNSDVVIRHLKEQIELFIK